MAVVLDTAVAGLDATSRPGALLFDSADKGAPNRLGHFEVLALAAHPDRAAVATFVFRPG